MLELERLSSISEIATFESTISVLDEASDSSKDIAVFNKVTSLSLEADLEFTEGEELAILLSLHLLHV